MTTRTLPTPLRIVPLTMLCFLFSEQQLRTTAQPRIGPSMAESCIAVAVGEEAREAAEIVLSVSVINEGGGGLISSSFTATLSQKLN